MARIFWALMLAALLAGCRMTPLPAVAADGKGKWEVNIYCGPGAGWQTLMDIDRVEPRLGGVLALYKGSKVVGLVTGQAIIAKREGDWE